MSVAELEALGSLVREEDGVARPPFPQTSAHVLHLHEKSVVAKTLFELPVAPCRPDRQRSAGTERGKGGSNAAVVIQTCVVGGRERRRAVVHVQEHDVIAAGVPTQREPHIPSLEPDASIP